MIIVHKQNGQKQKMSKADFEKLPSNVKEMYSIETSTPPEAKAEAAPKKKTSSKKGDSKEKAKADESSDV